jgi:N-acetylglucosamine-6-phosphate deacetylase
MEVRHTRLRAIVGGRVVTANGLEPAAVLIRDGVIERVAPTSIPMDGPVIDATGLLVAPGYIDLQCNGGHGIDLVTEPEGLWTLAAALPEYGVTSFLPTIVSSPPSIPERALKVLHRRPEGFCGAAPLGLHLEGPFLNPERRGAHRAAQLRPPSASQAAPWSRQAGVVMVTLAPELPGALNVVSELRRRGVVVAAGHTDASTAQMQAGVDAGIRAVTHLFNAMAPFFHREPGPIGVTMADSRLVAGVIVDGVHVHPTAVAATHAALGPERFAVVTDAVAALGQQQVNGYPPQARTRDGRLMGSVVGMDQAVRNLAAFTGCRPEVAMASATSTPARLISAAHKGQIAAGMDADIVVLTPGLDVMATVLGGVVAVDKIS